MMIAYCLQEIISLNIKQNLHKQFYLFSSFLFAKLSIKNRFKLQVSKMTEAEPELLSLLQKVANPLQQLSIKLTLHGIFAPPEQWKITDEANPNVFGYSIKILGAQYVGGKIQPRKLTEKQQRQLQQKSKKGAKKQTKQQQKPAEVDPAQQLRKQRQWDALSEQQKIYRTQQDPYKAFSLKFPQKQKQINFNAQSLQQLQDKINNDAIEIILTRKPQMSEDDLQKLKKSKPKNLNLGQLYAAVYKGTIKTKQLQKPGGTHISQRVKISLSGHVPDDGVKIQTQHTYIYVQLQCSQPITPQVKQIKPNTSQVIPNFPHKSEEGSNPILKLKAELCKSIKAISQEYVACFSKQKDHPEEKRHTNLSSISTLRLNQINKRKQLFLNQFVSSGKYNLLKQRISKSIKAVIIDKFRKQKQSSSITKQQINATLSQLNLYFQQQFMKTIDQFMVGDSTSVHEDLVLGYEHSRQVRKNIIAPICNETEIQRQTRLAGEYEILEKDYQEGQEYKAEKHYVNVLLLSNYSVQAKENYAKFCLKCRKFNQAYILYTQIAEESQQLHYKLIRAVLLVDRRRIQQATQLLDEMMQDPDCQTVNKINYNLLLSFMHQREKDIKSSEKYLAIAERYYKIKNNPHMKFTPSENPYQLPKPKVPKPQRYASVLTHAESQQIRLNFITILADLNLYNLVSEYLPKLQQSNKKTIFEIQADMFNKNYEEALTKIQSFLKRGDNVRNVDFLMIKADICYRSDKMFECEEIFLNILQLKPVAAKTIQIYLRLGYTYLSRKSWEDAKQVFQKAVQQKYNCSVAWLGLGISNLNLGRYDEAEQALNLCKIYNPLSNQTAEYQQLINEHQRTKYQLLTNTSRN